jgi:ketosteroid isomerase-like protein
MGRFDGEGLIAEYYPHIDRVDTDWVLALFAPDAVYDRADRTYAGIEAIGRFFREERQIRGEHRVERLWADPATRSVFVTGRFEGHGAAGDARSVGFADVWEFDAAGRVKHRQSYLSLGHAYVER